MKLDGLKVLDLSLYLPGPWLTQAMADHGADVIKVEPPGGEPVRNVGYRQNGASVWFRNTHRGKRSVMLDLKTAADKSRLLELAAEADVLVEAFRPGVAARLGMDYDRIAAFNPGIVYASISAFGQEGPLSQRPAHDIGMEALAGIVSLNLGQDGQPAMPHMPVADIIGSMTAFSGILMALLRRQTTGRGDYLDVAMLDATLSWLPNVTGPVFAEGRAPLPKNERSFGGYAFYNLYRCACGGWVAACGVEHKFIEAFLRGTGREDLLPDALGPLGPGQDRVKAALRDIFAGRSRAQWETFAATHDAALAPVLDLKEAFDLPNTTARGMLLQDAQGTPHIGTPFRFRNEPGQPRLELPELDQHRGQGFYPKA